MQSAIPTAVELPLLVLGHLSVEGECLFLVNPHARGPVYGGCLPIGLPHLSNWFTCLLHFVPGISCDRKLLGS